MKCINLLNRILLTISNGKYFKNYVFYRKLHLSEVKIVNELILFFLDLLETFTPNKKQHTISILLADILRLS